ncbi:hypothetical protein T484DRAFT_1786748, partial [Baffinella frigidus]
DEALRFNNRTALCCTFSFFYCFLIPGVVLSFHSLIPDAGTFHTGAATTLNDFHHAD